MKIQHAVLAFIKLVAQNFANRQIIKCALVEVESALNVKIARRCIVVLIYNKPTVYNALISIGLLQYFSDTGRQQVV